MPAGVNVVPRVMRGCRFTSPRRSSEWMCHRADDVEKFSDSAMSRSVGGNPFSRENLAMKQRTESLLVLSLRIYDLAISKVC